MARRLPVFPKDTWPPRMMADMAAAYCGEKHVEDFIERVGKTYPPPRVIKSSKRKFWYRPDLDRALGISEPIDTGLGARLTAIKELRSSRRKDRPNQ